MTDVTDAAALAAWRVALGQPHIQALLITAVFVACRLVTAASIGLGVDESYTISIAREWSLSYFDHPPLHLWIVHAFENVLGSGRAVRLPFIALSGATSWLMFLLSRRLFGAPAAVWATLAFNFAGFFTFAAGAWVLPDGPLNLCLIAAALALTGAIFPEREYSSARAWRGWLGGGALIGLAGLSKYQAALFCVGLPIFLATTREHRRWFMHPAPYAAAALALLVVSPVVVWNAEHGWVSFLFQGSRGAPKHALNLLAPMAALAGQAVLLLPWMFAPMAVAALAAARVGPREPQNWFCLMLALPAIMLFTLSPLWSDHSLPHWSMPGWLLLMPLVGDMLARNSSSQKWPARWAWGSALALAVLWPFVAIEATTGFLAKTFPAIGHDPTVELVEWTGLRNQITRRLQSPARCLFVAAVSWNEAGKISQAVGDMVPVRVFSSDPHGFAYLRQPADFTGCDALIIAQRSKIQEHLADLSPYFSYIHPFATDWEGRHSKEIELTILDAHNLLRPYPPAYRDH